jgi:hypothetical protein
VALPSLLLRFGERVAIEALISRTRRAEADDPVIPALVAVAFVMLPVLAVLFAVWLLTGRGPGLRLLTWSAGAPRQRPPHRR